MNDDQLLDEVFFIVKQCVLRASGTGNLDGLCAVSNHANSILETEFAGVLLTQLKLGFPSGYLDVIYKKDGGERQKTLFLSALNCAQNSIDYIERLSQRLNQENQGQRSQHEKEKLDSSLASFPALSNRMQAITDQGMQMLRASVIKPR